MKYALLILLALFCSAQVRAQQTLIVTDTAVVRTPIYNCGTDFSEHCKDVPGNGNDRLNCLLEHEKDLEHACKASVAAAVQRNRLDAMALDYVYSSCQSERLRLCGGTPSGGGRLLQCLKTNQAGLGGDCIRTLKNSGLWDAQLQPAAGE